MPLDKQDLRRIETAKKHAAEHFKLIFLTLGLNDSAAHVVAQRWSDAAVESVRKTIATLVEG